jgi:nitric oxide dioxygenase
MHWPAFKPGHLHYRGVCLFRDGQTTMRNYSIPTSQDRIGPVSALQQGKGPQGRSSDGYASNYLHDQINAGSAVEIAAPCGEFFLM